MSLALSGPGTMPGKPDCCVLELFEMHGSFFTHIHGYA
jgi:hypothetical protein